MTERERLVELIEKTFYEQYYKRGVFNTGTAADYFLENGVIIAPMPIAEWLRQELTEYVYKRCLEEL